MIYVCLYAILVTLKIFSDNWLNVFDSMFKGCKYDHAIDIDIYDILAILYTNNAFAWIIKIKTK